MGKADCGADAPLDRQATHVFSPSLDSMIGSSRKLEAACCYRSDFIWLVQGRRIDHATFSKFRTRFDDALNGLFRQIGRTAVTLGLIRLGMVGFDGTRVKANNSHHKTRTAKTREEKLYWLDEWCEQMLAGVNACETAVASVDRIEETFGQQPEQFVTDAGTNSGQVIEGMESRGVELDAPVESSQPRREEAQLLQRSRASAPRCMAVFWNGS